MESEPDSTDESVRWSLEVSVALCGGVVLCLVSLVLVCVIGRRRARRSHFHYADYDVEANQQCIQDSYPGRSTGVHAHRPDILAAVRVAGRREASALNVHSVGSSVKGRQSGRPTQQGAAGAQDQSAESSQQDAGGALQHLGKASAQDQLDGDREQVQGTLGTRQSARGSLQDAVQRQRVGNVQDSEVRDTKQLNVALHSQQSEDDSQHNKQEKTSAHTVMGPTAADVGPTTSAHWEAARVTQSVQAARGTQQSFGDDGTEHGHGSADTQHRLKEDYSQQSRDVASIEEIRSACNLVQSDDDCTQQVRSALGSVKHKYAIHAWLAQDSESTQQSEDEQTFNCVVNAALDGMNKGGDGEESTQHSWGADDFEQSLSAESMQYSQVAEHTKLPSAAPRRTTWSGIMLDPQSIQADSRGTSTVAAVSSKPELGASPTPHWAYDMQDIEWAKGDEQSEPPLQGARPSIQVTSARRKSRCSFPRLCESAEFDSDELEIPDLTNEPSAIRFVLQERHKSRILFASDPSLDQAPSPTGALSYAVPDRARQGAGDCTGTAFSRQFTPTPRLNITNKQKANSSIKQRTSPDVDTYRKHFQFGRTSLCKYLCCCCYGAQVKRVTWTKPQVYIAPDIPETFTNKSDPDEIRKFETSLLSNAPNKTKVSSGVFKAKSTIDAVKDDLSRRRPKNVASDFASASAAGSSKSKTDKRSQAAATVDTPIDTFTLPEKHSKHSKEMAETVKIKSSQAKRYLNEAFEQTSSEDSVEQREQDGGLRQKHTSDTTNRPEAAHNSSGGVKQSDHRLSEHQTVSMTTETVVHAPPVEISVLSEMFTTKADDSVDKPSKDISTLCETFPEKVVTLLHVPSVEVSLLSDTFTGICLHRPSGEVSVLSEDYHGDDDTTPCKTESPLLHPSSVSTLNFGFRTERSVSFASECSRSPSLVTLGPTPRPDRRRTEATAAQCAKVIGLTSAAVGSRMTVRGPMAADVVPMAFYALGVGSNVSGEISDGFTLSALDSPQPSVSYSTPADAPGLSDVISSVSVHPKNTVAASGGARGYSSSSVSESSGEEFPVTSMYYGCKMKRADPKSSLSVHETTKKGSLTKSRLPRPSQTMTEFTPTEPDSVQSSAPLDATPEPNLTEFLRESSDHEAPSEASSSGPYRTHGKNRTPVSGLLVHKNRVPIKSRLPRTSPRDQPRPISFDEAKTRRTSTVQNVRSMHVMPYEENVCSPRLCITNSRMHAGTDTVRSTSGSRHKVIKEGPKLSDPTQQRRASQRASASTEAGSKADTSTPYNNLFECTQVSRRRSQSRPRLQRMNAFDRDSDTPAEESSTPGISQPVRSSPSNPFKPVVTHQSKLKTELNVHQTTAKKGAAKSEPRRRV